jgi:threonine/homoserine/homoserine lactone efflux protein
MLIGFDQAAGFLAVAVVITLAPGPDNVMVMSLGAARGWRAGVVFGLGCACGCLSVRPESC